MNKMHEYRSDHTQVWWDQCKFDRGTSLCRTPFVGRRGYEFRFHLAFQVSDVDLQKLFVHADGRPCDQLYARVVQSWIDGLGKLGDAFVQSLTENPDGD